jgi:hypothetical protein
MGTNSDRKIVIDIDEYIGAVKLNSLWRFFYDILSMWIFDYASYHPDYSPTPQGWRANLLRVNEANAKEYCSALANHELHPEQIPHVEKQSFVGQEPLMFVANFDEKLFINGWRDNIAIHEYAPQGWTAVEDDPYKYIPSEYRALWGK